MFLPLVNGSHVIMEASNPRGDTFVLAQTDRDYVIWYVDTDRNCFSGDYYSLSPDGLQMALSAFRTRSGA